MPLPLRFLLLIFATLAAACSSTSTGSGVSTDGGPDSPLESANDAAPDSGSDSAPSDARADVVSDSSTSDVVSDGSPSDGGSGSDTGTNHDSGYTAPDGGWTGAFPGEMAPPYTSARCQLWGTTPPIIQYGQGALAESNEGIWVGSGSAPDVLRYSGGTWYLSQLPPQNPPDITVLAMYGGTGWAAALATTNLISGPEHLYYHATGQPWTDITAAPGAPASWFQWPPFPTLYGAGAYLMVGGTYFDGSSWQTIPNPPGAPTAATAIDGPPDDLYLASASGIQHYDGSTWTSITSPTTSALSALASLGNGQLLAVVASTTGIPGVVDVYYRGSTGTWNAVPTCNSEETFEALFRSGTTAFVSLACESGGSGLYQFSPTTGALDLMAGSSNFTAVAVDAQGDTFGLTGDLGMESLYEAPAGGGFAPVPASLDVPLALPGLLTGRSSSELYATAADGGLLAFDGGSWTALDTPDAASPVPAALWQASDGTVFVAENVTPDASVYPEYAMHRWVGGVWTDDGTISGVPSGLGHYLSNIVGRSSSDAYIGVDTDTFHWQGSAWTAMGLGTCDGIPQLGLAVAPDIFLDCKGQGGQPTVLEWDGTPGTASVALATGNFVPAAPGAMLVFTQTSTGISWNAGQGWTALPVAPPGAAGSPTGSDASHVVSFDDGTFARWNGTAWSTYSDPLTSMITSTTIAWTDGTYAAVEASNGLLLCDLGP